MSGTDEPTSLIRVPYDPENPDVIIKTSFGTLHVLNYPITPRIKDPREDENYQALPGAGKDDGVKWDDKDLKVSKHGLCGRFTRLYTKTIDIIEIRWDQCIATGDYGALESFSTRDLGLVLVAKILPIYTKLEKSYSECRPKSKEAWIEHVTSNLRQACDTVRSTVPQSSSLWSRLSPDSPTDDTIIPSIHARTGSASGGPIPPSGD